MPENQLYYGDNLDVLRRHVADESVDLVYLDPPFNSNANYNVLFAEKDGRQAAAQIQVFEDTWRWDESAARQFAEAVEQGGRVADVLLAFERFLGTNDMLAYLAMMAPRLVELRRVLRPTGSLYLHCDPTASHYLKALLDAVFGAANFRNEIVWLRSHPKGHAFTRFANNHDIIFAYAKDTSKTKWNAQYSPYDPEKVQEQYSLQDKDGRRYQLTSLLNPNPDRPNLTYEFLGVTKVWRWTKDRMMEEYRKGRIVVPRAGKGIPRYKRYLDEQEGIPVGDVWTDIGLASGAERLGYPTQKPVALLERIIAASSDRDDVVLDPFCGCGTTIEAAQKLGRSWIGIDVTHLAITLIKARLLDAFGSGASFEVVGEPTTAEDAAALAESDKYQFQWWALGLVGARPVEQKKGADKGVDGRLYFHDGTSSTRQIVISVKGGKLKATDVRDLRGVMDREKAEIGVLLSFEEPTKAMRAEAASAGFFKTQWGDHSRLQLLTVAELLEGKGIDYPRTAGTNITYKAAPQVERKVAEPPTLFDGAPKPVPKKKSGKK